MDNEFKERIKDWLKEQGFTRDWLAARCGVEVKTVNNWLSSPRPIPAKAILILHQLMEATAESVQTEPTNVLIVKIDDHRFDAYSAKALEEGFTLRNWVINSLDEAAELDQVASITPIYQPRPVESSKVAEAPDQTGSNAEPNPIEDLFPDAGSVSDGSSSPGASNGTDA